MTTNLATILATKIRTALEVDHSHDDAHTLATIGVLVEQAGLSLTPLPEQEQPRVSTEEQRWPDGVEVAATRWVVYAHGHFAGIVSSDMLSPSAEGATHHAHYLTTYSTHASLDEAVAYLVAQRPDALAQAYPGLAEAAEAGLALTITPERSIERGRDDAEEDSRREAEAVS